MEMPPAIRGDARGAWRSRGLVLGWLSWVSGTVTVTSPESPIWLVGRRWWVVLLHQFVV